MSKLDAGYSTAHAEVAAGAYVQLTITDSDSGMDASTMGRIFDPFFTTKVVGRGTGLGLATVYGIVKQAGGHIWVYSKPGKGTTFKIYFPQAPPGAGVPTAVATAAKPSGGHETALVVEDQQELRQLISRVLESLGYQVLCACDSDEALQAGARAWRADRPVDYRRGRAGAQRS